MYSNPKDLLIDIAKEMDYIERVTVNMIDYTFYQDETIKRAVERSLEIIGEAAGNLSQEFRQKYNSIKWNELKGMRNIVIHHYKGIDYTIVWNIVKNEIPVLKLEVSKILNDLENIKQ